MTKLPTPIVKPVADDEAGPLAQKIFDQIRQQTGKVPQWMRVMANCEDTLSGFFALFKSVMDDAPTDRLLKWKIAFVVSELNKCHYCVSVSKQQLLALGIAESDLQDIERGCDEKECLALQYAREVTLNAYKIEDSLLLALKEHFTDQQIVEITSVIGLFNFINRFNDALRVFPEVK